MRRLVYYFVLFCFFSTAILAEKIKLKDGGVVRGKVVSETSSELVIANEYGNITIEKKNIAKRVKEKSDIPSFSNSRYSFKKRSWPKYAFLATGAAGVVTTGFMADRGLALVTGFSFLGVALVWAALDYFRYGRVAKRIRRRFGFQSPGFSPWASEGAVNVAFLAPSSVPDLSAKEQPIRFGASYRL